MPLKNYIKGLGGSNVNDLANLLAVQLFMPFTDSLDDKSIYSRLVTSVGVTLGIDGAIYDSITDRILCDIELNDFTIELIFKGFSANQPPGRIINLFSNIGSTSGEFVSVEIYNGKLTFLSPSTIYATADIQQDTTYHFALIRKDSSINLYFNGSKVGNPYVVSTQVKSLRLGTVYDNGRGYIGTLGGLKVTNKALEPSQFSMARPMQLKYPSFKVGNREYVYKDGVWNPNFERTIVGSVLFNPNAIVVNASLSIYSTLSIILDIAPTKKVFMDYKITTVSASPNTDYLTLINSGGDYTIFDLGLWETNKSRRIVGMLMGKYNKMFSISSYAKQQVLVYGIWIE